LDNSEKNQSARKKITREDMSEIVAKARRSQEDKMKGYREKSLSIHPWICARCGMEFTLKNLHLLTVHHRDHDHDNNPADGSNWENLCVYCHDNEHRRYTDHLQGEMPDTGTKKTESVTHKPFAALADLLKKK
jgi:hypothetical protein